jgi:hypothetical protein
LHIILFLNNFRRKFAVSENDRKRGKITVEEAGRMGGKKLLRPMVQNSIVKLGEKGVIKFVG